MGTALPLYFTILSLVIILLFLYVIIQCRMKSHTIKRPLPLPISTAGSPPAATIPFIGGGGLSHMQVSCDSNQYQSSSQTSNSSSIYYTQLARAQNSLTNHTSHGNHRHSYRHRYNQLSAPTAAKWPRPPGGANIVVGNHRTSGPAPAIVNNSFRSQKNTYSQNHTPTRKQNHYQFS